MLVNEQDLLRLLVEAAKGTLALGTEKDRSSDSSDIEVPDDISDILVVGPVTVPIVEEESAESREWGTAMKRVQFLSDEELFSAVEDPHPGARCEALLRLRARCGTDPRTLTLIIEALKDQDWRVRDSAVDQLHNLIEVLDDSGRKEAVDAMRSALEDEHEDVRASARLWLGQLGESESD